MEIGKVRSARNFREGETWEIQSKVEHHTNEERVKTFGIRMEGEKDWGLRWEGLGRRTNYQGNFRGGGDVDQDKIEQTRLSGFILLG
jgi:hypothetical protein